MSDTTNKTSSPPPAGRTLAKMAGGAQIQAIVPTTLGETFALAEMVHTSGLAPNSIATPQALCVVFMKGLEIGLGPMAAMECIGIINNKACLHSDGIPTLLWTHGFQIEEHYTGDSLATLVAHCKITRPSGKEFTFSYGTADAKENGLWNPGERDHKQLQRPWQRYTKRMIKMRCRGWLARDCASDALKGMPIYEEQADIALDRNEYHEVKRAALEVPADIPDETAPLVSEAEAPQDGPLANPERY